MNNKEKILTELFEDSEKEFHIRLLARIVKLNPNTIGSLTDELAKEGLVKKWGDNERGIKIIKANTESELFKLKKRAYNIEKIWKSGLLDFLNKCLGYPTIFLFGSYAKAENSVDSDIDLFVISDKKENIPLDKFEKILNSKIQLFLHTKKDFEQVKKKNPELVNNVLNGIKLSGYLDIL